MPLVYDIAAISTDSSGDPTTTHYGTHTVTASSGAGDTVSQQVATLMDTMLIAAGWTNSTSTLSNSRTIKEYYGLQSPWYDSDAVPSWYTENIPWVRVNPSASATQIRVTGGMWNGTNGTYTSTSELSQGLTSTPGKEYLMWANPFQFVYGSPSDSGHGFVFSALHIPDFVQERAQVKNAMFLTFSSAFKTSFNVDNLTTWTLYESRVDGSGVQSWTGDPNQSLMLISQLGGGLRNSEPAGSYIWNETDTAMGTSSNWYAQIYPPTVAWLPGTARPSSTTNSPLAIGMLWDCIAINRALTFVSVISKLPETPTAEQREWVILGSSVAEFPTSLAYITGLTN